MNSLSEFGDDIIDNDRKNNEAEAGGNGGNTKILFVGCGFASVALMMVIFAVIASYFWIHYQVQDQQNTNLRAQLYSTKKSKETLENEHPGFVNEIDQFKKEADQFKQELDLNTRDVQTLEQEVVKLNEKIPCLKILMYEMEAIVFDQEKFSTLHAKLNK